MTTLRQAASKSARRAEAVLAAQAYYAENFPARTYQGGTIGITGTIYFMSLGLLAGDVVTNILVNVATLGSGFSGIGARVGIYSSAAAQLATSGDVSATLGATGVKPLPLSAAYTITADGFYYAALISIATTVPTLQRAGNGVKTTFNGLLNFGTQTGQTDLTAPATLAETSNLGYWVGIS